MNLRQLKERFWWTIDDNPANPLLVSEDVVVQLINDALRDLTRVLHREVVDDTLEPDLDGRVTLPDDFAASIEVRWNGKEIVPIERDQKPSYTDGVVSQYAIPNLRTMQLYDAPLNTGILTIKYLAYPPELVNDEDTPLDVPLEFHEALATVYARAQYAKKLGYMDQYSNLSALWEGIKDEIGREVEVRTEPINFDRRWSW